MLKAKLATRPLWRGGLNTLGLGGGAALLAFLVGGWLGQMFGV